MNEYDVVIIGAGTSGLSARKEVIKKTQNYLLLDDGPLGTTCARVGCMPSKVLIQVANDFNRRKKFTDLGIRGGGDLQIDTAQVMNHVRSLRDRFVKGVKSPMAEWEDKFLPKRAVFEDPHILNVEGERINAHKIILAAGTRPAVPEVWKQYSDFLVDTNSFFELKSLPQKMAVIGLGVIGIELGQALSRLGVDIFAVTRGGSIGGLSDPDIQEYVKRKFSEEFPIYVNGGNPVGISDGGLLKIEVDGKILEVEKVLMATGRRTNLDKLGIEMLPVKLNSRGIPSIDKSTMQVTELPHIFLPGDVNADRPILHEAADEGKIAGFNAVNELQCFKRRTFLGVTFSDPNIAAIGKRHADLIAEKRPFETGEISFEGQGRSIVKLKEQGLLHIYADKNTGEILGAELQAPDGEHLAHLIAWAISMKLTVFEALKMPFYHPVIEEGLRTALRDCATKIGQTANRSELFRCEDPPIR